MLTTSDYECLEPVGHFDDDSVFSWRGTLPSSGQFEVFVCEEKASGGRGKVLFTSGRWDKTSWTATHAQMQSLPDAIVWYVRVFDGAGQYVTESPQARAQRSQH